MASLKKAVVKLRNLPRGRAKRYPAPLRLTRVLYQKDTSMYIPEPRVFLRLNKSKILV